MIRHLIRAVRRLASEALTVDPAEAPRACAREDSEMTTEAGGGAGGLVREEIEARVFNLVLFLRERPCGNNGLGSADRCGLPHRASRCGVHAALEQLGADVASLLDQLEQLHGRVDAGEDALHPAPGSLDPDPSDPERVSGEEPWEVGLSGEQIISETIKLTQKIQMRG